MKFYWLVSNLLKFLSTGKANISCAHAAVALGRSCGQKQSGLGGKKAGDWNREVQEKYFKNAWGWAKYHKKKKRTRRLLL